MYLVTLELKRETQISSGTLANKEQPRGEAAKVVGVAGDNLHGNFYRLGRGGNIRQTRLRSRR